MLADEPKQPQSRETGAKSIIQRSESDTALLTLGVIMGSGILGTIIFALQASSRMEFISFASVGVLVGGASALIGGLLGFLFGIPRTLQQDSPVPVISARE